MKYPVKIDGDHYRFLEDGDIILKTDFRYLDVLVGSKVNRVLESVKFAIGDSWTSCYAPMYRKISPGEAKIMNSIIGYEKGLSANRMMLVSTRNEEAELIIKQKELEIARDECAICKTHVLDASQLLKELMEAWETSKSKCTSLHLETVALEESKG